MIMIVLRVIVFQPLYCVASTDEKPQYRQPSLTQLNKAEQLFIWLFSQQSLKKAHISAKELGYHWRENKNSIHLKDNGKIGWGDYRFSKHKTSGIVIMAPHRYHDKYTGVITKTLFNKHNLTSIALNSISRYSNNQQQSSADLAHLANSLHTAYARAFVTQFPEGKLIQLHGFNAHKRRTITAKMADAILSNGTAWSSKHLLTLQTCLSKPGWQSVRFPQQVSELGGSKNSIGGVLRYMGHSGFIHIELNASIREKLVNNKILTTTFAHCILGLAL